ncbi:MAG: replication protein RepA [Pseudomonadota bacterium]|nr:replication protein RepA [Pseudomonadota bacterium]
MIDPLVTPELPDGVRDEDLIRTVEQARGTITYKATLTVAQATQAKRDAERAAAQRQLDAVQEAERQRAGLTRDARRRHIIREVIENEPATPENIQHIHSVLALCGLPYREPKGVTSFFKEYGRNTLAINAGRLTNPVTGEMEMQCIPYGPKARLMLLHLCTEAVRQRTPKIEVASSLSGFIRDMGFPVTGGDRGTLRQFKEQLNRLAACSMQIGLWDGTRASTLNVPPFRQMDVWLPINVDPDQGLLWSSTITFHRDFFDNLLQHALPVDMRAARAFAGSARKLDLLFWVGYRLSRLERPLRLTWDNLYKQFGSENGSIRSFRQEFRKDVAHLTEVFPRLRLTLDDGGMQLLPSDLKDLLVPPKAALANKRARARA